MCLQDGKLGCRQHTACNIAQPVFFVFLFLAFDKEPDRFLDQPDEPDHNKCITYIERRMESSQFKGNSHRRIGNAHYMRDEPGNGICERIKQNQYPDNAEYIENKVRQSRPSGLCITCQSRQVGCNRCTDIFTQYERYT